MTEDDKALCEALRERADRIKGNIASCQIIVDYLAPEMSKFEARDGVHDIYTVRMSVDHQSSIRSQTKELAEYEAAIDRIEVLSAEVERLTYDGIHTCSDDCQRPMCVMRRDLDKAEARNAKMVDACNAYVKAYDEGTGTIHVNKIIRTALGEHHD